MNSYPREIYSLMARCLAGESTPGEVNILNGFLENDPVLRMDFELYELLFFDRYCNSPMDEDTKKELKRIENRLKSEGLL